MNDITAPLSPDDNEAGERTAWYEKRIIVPPVASAQVNTETWDMIVDAMKKNRVIAFEYKGYFDDDYKTRLVRPYQLLFDTGTWFLYGYAEERSAIRIFSLSRMKNVSITNESFKLPEDFDFGIFAGEKQRFKITFNEFAAKDIHDRLWAKDQKITEQENNEGIIIEFTSTQYGKVLSWVLSFGSGASPVEPPELVEQWKENIVELYECING